MGQNREFKYRVDFSKRGPAIYFSHLDLLDTLVRALRRSGLPFSISQGCHKRPRVMFGPPLPLGHSSRCEFFVLSLDSEVPVSSIREALGAELPQGFLINQVAPLEQSPGLPAAVFMVSYFLGFGKGGQDAIGRVERFLGNPEGTVLVRKKDGEKTFRLAPAVKKIQREPGEEGNEGLTVDFLQGSPETPSVSKIIQALVTHLGPDRENLTIVERKAFLPC